MSKVSRKSELSPSITRGSNGIDLGKNNGVDMGRKSEPSLTSGGIGITQEITSVGGMNVSGGIEIDVTPVDFGINYDASENTVSIATGAEIPGGIIGVSGGIEIDLNTGEVTGGSIGGEALGLGINVSNSKKGGIGIEFTVQIPGTPIELSLGFGFPPKQPTSPTPAPSPTPTPTNPFNPSNFSTSQNCEGGKWELMITTYEDFVPKNFPVDEGIPIALQRYIWNTYNPYLIPGTVDDIQAAEMAAFVAKQNHPSLSFFWKDGGIEVEQYESDSLSGFWEYFVFDGIKYAPTGQIVNNVLTIRRRAKRKLYYPVSSYTPYELRYQFGNWGSPYEHELFLVNRDPAPPCPFPSPSPSPSPGPSPPPSPSPSPSPSPFPNPPPRTQNKMDACCKENLAFLRLIYTRLGLSKFPGQLPNTIIQEVAEEGEEPAEPPQVPIPDLVSFLNWTFERDDERWGQWVVQINVKDSDITKEGDQGKQVKFPNLAESIAEIEGQILSVSANVDALVAITTKNLVESGLGRQEAIKGYLAAKSIIKYMAFKTTEIDVDIPACFTQKLKQYTN